MDVTSDDFDAVVLEGDRAVLVDFWADWCAPCKALAPTLNELAEVYRDEIGFVKVDVDAHEALRERFGAQTIPTLLMFKDGVEVGRHVGNATKTRIAAFIDANR